jgi:hypothetical protein
VAICETRKLLSEVSNKHDYIISRNSLKLNDRKGERIQLSAVRNV